MNDPDGHHPDAFVDAEVRNGLGRRQRRSSDRHGPEVTDDVDDERDSSRGPSRRQAAPEGCPHGCRVHTVSDADHRREHGLGVDDVLRRLGPRELGGDKPEVVGCPHELVGSEIGLEEALEVRVPTGIATVDQAQGLFRVRAVSSSELGGGDLGDGSVEVNAQLDLRDGCDVELGRQGRYRGFLSSRKRHG